jgi:biotin carboxylase
LKGQIFLPGVINYKIQSSLKRKILIVGGGSGQLPAIIRAKEIGLEVINVDLDPNAPGMRLAHFAYQVDVVDKEGVLKIARKHGVHGIMTMQSDLPVPTIGYVNDNLNLAGVSLKVANHCSNKIETRLRLAEQNCAQPRFQATNSLEATIIAAADFGFPCVVKAPDSSGSRGVVKVDLPEDVEPAYLEALSFSRGKDVLVEEYIQGIEFGAQTFSEEGKCKLVLLHNDTMSSAPYMIPIGHSFPFVKLSELQQAEAINDIIKAIDSLGIENGPANVDLILDEKTKRIKIIEVGARIGATCLPELIYYHTGIDWVEATLLNAIGEKADLVLKSQKPVAAVIVESPADGIFRSFQVFGDEGGLLELEITAKNGDKVNKLKKGTDRIGKILAFGLDAKAAELKVLAFKDLIKIEVEKP